MVDVVVLRRPVYCSDKTILVAVNKAECEELGRM